MKITAKPGTFEAVKEAAKIARSTGIKVTWVKHETFKNGKPNIYPAKNKPK